MRRITGHTINPANDKLTITATDEPGSGGANHRYEIEGYRTWSNPSVHAGEGPIDEPPGDRSPQKTIILFQNGPINEVGVNGITQEALLAIVIDRLRSFQAGPYACYENEKALGLVKEARNWLLQQRTINRRQRGVEGKSVV